MNADLTNLKQRIAEAREKYRPTHIKCILVAEAPPNDLRRFFYYPDVKEADYLFLGVMGILYPKLKKEYIDKGRPRSLKQKLLSKFKSDGFYLLDFFDVPVDQYTESRETAISDLVQRLHRVATDKTPVVLIKATVYDTLAERLKQAGFQVIEERIRFPAQGWQQSFQSQFVKALKKATVR